jgi:riboflavin kinase/FMN adenylyltransferase
LTTPGEKAALLDALGLDLLVLLPFDSQMADTPARDFMEAVSRHLRVRELWVGVDFTLGRNRAGDVAHLSELGSELGFRVHVAEPVAVDGHVVSSSRIRAALRQGRVEEATRLLGRYPSVAGKVDKGTLQRLVPGFPTVSLEVRQGTAVPAEGVYAVFARLGTQRYPAVANMGVRPTCDKGQQTVGVQILGFDNGQASTDHFHGCDMVIEFVTRLRSEQRFQDTEGSVAQMERDIKEARQILGRMPQEDSSSEARPAANRSLASACPYRYEEVEHTADRALSVWGNQLPDLFAGAARGMYSLMADLDGLVAITWRRVRLEDWDRESLLVAWLNELLFLTEAEGLLFVECRIESLTDTALVAQVGGAPGSVNQASIKATTFHDLALVREGDGWATVITFDV